MNPNASVNLTVDRLGSSFVQFALLTVDGYIGMLQVFTVLTQPQGWVRLMPAGTIMSRIGWYSDSNSPVPVVHGRYEITLEPLGADPNGYVSLKLTVELRSK